MGIHVRTIHRPSSADLAAVARRFFGPALTLAMAGGIAALPFAHMNAVPLVLVLTVGYAALEGGMGSGLASAAIAAAFCAHYYWAGGGAGSLLYYATSDAERLVGLMLALPVVVLTLATLRRRIDDLTARERGQRAETAAERERLASILESITDGFFALDRQWRYTYVNREAERLVGRTREELLGKSVWECFPLLVGSAWEREYRRALHENVPVHLESYYAPLDDWFETHAYPSEAGLTIYMRSIRKRKLAEQQLRARVLQQSAVAALGQRALSGTDLGALLQSAVEAVASTLDVPLVKVLELQPGGEELVIRAGVGWKEGVEHRVSAHERSQAGYTLDSRGPVLVADLAAETRFQGPKLLLDHGVVSGVSVIISGCERACGILGAHTRTKRVFSHDDVSFVQSVANVLGEAIARKRAETTLAESEERFRQLADNMREVFYVHALHPHRALYVSPGYEALWGRPRASLFEDPASWLAAVHPEDRPAVERQFARIETEYFDMEYRLVRPDGTVRWVHDRGSIVRRGSEAYGRLVGIAEDVTAHKEAEDRARRLAASEASVRARDGVLAVVAHDLRNPLSSISMAASLLRKPQVDAERRERYAQTIGRSVQTAERLIRDLLDVARIEAGQLVVETEPLEVEPLLHDVQDVLQLVAREKEIVLEHEAVDGVPPVAGDRDRILQALGNLVGNAIKFTPRGGRITVRARAVRGAAEISVSDTGPGIPPDALPHVFDRFWRGRPTERRGLGLGLAIVQGIVTAHHGRVWAESEPGTGSTFRFTIPFAAAAAS